jgi:hypothetical protein
MFLSLGLQRRSGAVQRNVMRLVRLSSILVLEEIPPSS